MVHSFSATMHLCAFLVMGVAVVLFFASCVATSAAVTTLAAALPRHWLRVVLAIKVGVVHAGNDNNINPRNDTRNKCPSENYTEYTGGCLTQVKFLGTKATKEKSEHKGHGFCFLIFHTKNKYNLG